MLAMLLLLGGRLGHFYFFLVGEVEGGVRGREEGGDRFLIQSPRRGVCRGEGPRAGRVSAANWGIFWGGGGG